MKILFILSIILNAVMDSIYSNDTFAKYGLWFSRDGWKYKYLLTEWLNKYLPLGLSKFLAQDVLVVFTDLWHLCKSLFIAILCYFFMPDYWLLAYLVWSVMFNILYSIIR